MQNETRSTVLPMLEKHFVLTVHMIKAMSHLPVPVPAQHWPCKFQLHLEVTAEQK